MKRIATNFILILSLAAFTTGALSILSSCSKDDEQEHSDPNVFCNEGLCAANAAKKQQCIDAFNTCIANNPDVNDDECVATALIICN